MTDRPPTRAAANSRWLVRDVHEEALPDLRRWLPAALTAHAAFRGPGAPAVAAELSYVVVDEIVDDDVGLDVSPWPWADREGRLRFLDGVRAHIGCPRAALQAQLYGPGGPAPRIGDVFGVRLRPEARRRLAASPAAVRVGDLRALFDGPVYDLSEAARTVSKLAYFGAMATVLSERQAADDNLLPLVRTAEAPARVRFLDGHPQAGPPMDVADGGPDAPHGAP